VAPTPPCAQCLRFRCVDYQMSYLGQRSHRVPVKRCENAGHVLSTPACQVRHGLPVITVNLRDGMARLRMRKCRPASTRSQIERIVVDPQHEEVQSLARKVREVAKVLLLIRRQQQPGFLPGLADRGVNRGFVLFTNTLGQVPSRSPSGVTNEQLAPAIQQQDSAGSDHARQGVPTEKCIWCGMRSTANI
jgi:hypothetical protein